MIEGYNSIPPVNSTAFESTFAAANLQTLPVQLNDTSNTASLHTVSTCALRDQGIQTGTTESPTCDASVNGNQVSFFQPNTWQRPLGVFSARPPLLLTLSFVLTFP